MKLPIHPAATLLFCSSLLSACGGGGGDPGACHGSPEVCSEGQASTTAPTNTNSGVTGATTTTTGSTPGAIGPVTNSGGGY